MAKSKTALYNALHWVGYLSGIIAAKGETSALRRRLRAAVRTVYANMTETQAAEFRARVAAWSIEERGQLVSRSGGANG